jgi:pSer/pThr/pTyr-binding forkhead associated (FHA) protein
MRFTFEIEAPNLRFFGPTRTVTLDQDIIKIGVLPSSHLLLDDAEVSRMHAVIEVNHEGVFIIDLGSIAGTIVNGKKISRHKLQNGDILTLGRTRIIVSFQ